MKQKLIAGKISHKTFSQVAPSKSLSTKQLKFKVFIQQLPSDIKNKRNNKKCKPRKMKK